MESKRTCPECHLIFEAELPATGVLVCPLCNSTFAVLPPAGTAAPSTASGRQMLHGVAAVGTVVLLAAGMGYAYHLLSGIDHKAPSVPAPVAHDSPAPLSPPTVEYVPVIPIQPMPPVMVPQQPPFRAKLPPPPLVEKPQRSLPLPERINDAIDRGLAHLRKSYSECAHYRNYLGLLGLTLLECGVGAEDPTVRQIAAWIRSQGPQIMQTYELTLAILFLDRLGNRRDRTLIRSLGQRLLGGQLGCGAWSYSCLVSDWQRKRPNFWKGFGPPRQQNAYRGDNSNTQFALLGLWVAQRYGVSAHAALLTAEQYFRTTQANDGSWSYHPKAPSHRDSMTCAGLMSLAMRHGISAGQGRDIRPNRPVSVYDAAVLRGLRYLAQSLDKISVSGNRIAGVEASEPLYFLWSLERMAVIYDLKKVGEREWYPWTAELLVETQWRDGRWIGWGEPVATCFALLVLRRSNFAKDLQLAVQEQPLPSMPHISGPTILQGMDAIVEQTHKTQPPARAPLGPSIKQAPNTK